MNKDNHGIGWNIWDDHVTAVTLVGPHKLGGHCTLLQGLSPGQSLKALFLGFWVCGKYLLQTTDRKLAEKSMESIGNGLV